MTELVDLAVRGRTAILTLQRPEKRNALSTELCDLLREAVTTALADGARALVVTGAGSAFCAGADLDGVYGPEFRDALYGMLRAVADAPVPVVAAVNGPAIGAGTQLAIACDVRVAAPAAVFGIPTAANGLAVDPWTIRRFALLAGQGTARAVLLGLDRVDADRAHALGLAERLGSVEDAIGWAERIAELAPLTLEYSKRTLAALFEDTGYDAGSAFDAIWGSADVVEGRAARAEKRAPRFEGR